MGDFKIVWEECFADPSAWAEPKKPIGERTFRAQLAGQNGWLYRHVCYIDQKPYSTMVFVPGS